MTNAYPLLLPVALSLIRSNLLISPNGLRMSSTCKKGGGPAAASSPSGAGPVWEGGAYLVVREEVGETADEDLFPLVHRRVPAHLLGDHRVVARQARPGAAQAHGLEVQVRVGLRRAEHDGLGGVVVVGPPHAQLDTLQRRGSVGGHPGSVGGHPGSRLPAR